MARKINRLNARAVATITKHGRHADGGSLYLSIHRTVADAGSFFSAGTASPLKSDSVRHAM
jgi:hypothetical protein